MAAPAAAPVTTPVELTVAVDVEPDVHAPLLTELLSVVVAPAQTVELPVIVPAPGNEVTVMLLVATAAPQPLVTV